MPSDKPKLLLVIDEDLLKQVDDFRYSNRIPSRAEAVRQLLRDGLQYNQSAPAVQEKK